MGIIRKKKKKITHVSIYAQTRSLGSAAFARKNNELNELTRLGEAPPTNGR